jgi:uncharacterized protein (DUF433 family)
MGTHEPPTIVRTERGLVISGTRIMVYSILDYVHDNWTTDEIRDILRLTDAQVRVALDYIAAHRDAVEAEYQQVLAEAEEIRRYWEERNRERFARIAATPLSPEKLALLAEVERRHAKRIPLGA